MPQGRPWRRARRASAPESPEKKHRRGKSLCQRLTRILDTIRTKREFVVLFGVLAWLVSVFLGITIVTNVYISKPTQSHTTSVELPRVKDSLLTSVLVESDMKSRLGPVSLTSLSKSIPNASLAKLFWVQGKTNGEGHYIYERILLANGWARARSVKENGIFFHFAARYVPKINGKFAYFKPNENVVNRLPGEHSIFSKIPLVHNLRSYQDKMGCDYRRVHPESFVLSDIADCSEFFYPNRSNDYYPDGEARRWFWKPPASSFGRGIRLVTKAKLREHLGVVYETPQPSGNVSSLRSQCQSLGNRFRKQNLTSVVQAAVHPPLKIKGCKFDIRMYILIANTDPLVVFSRIGHVRRCLIEYDIASPSKKTHVCNDYSDKLDNPLFDIHEHLWSLQTFSRYMESQGIYNVVDAVELEISRLAQTVFLSVKNKIPRANGYWSLLGADVAVLEDMTMRILEVNTNPSVHYDTKTWPRFQPEENLLMMGEVLERVLGSHNLAKMLRENPTKAKTIIDKRDLSGIFPASESGWSLLFLEAWGVEYQKVDALCR